MKSTGSAIGTSQTTLQGALSSKLIGEGGNLNHMHKSTYLATTLLPFFHMVFKDVSGKANEPVQYATEKQ